MGHISWRKMGYNFMIWYMTPEGLHLRVWVPGQNEYDVSFNAHSAMLKFHILNLTYMSQESPPAWTQEAYRPPCSKYSLCCPNWVPPRAGYPPNKGTPPARVPPQPGYPPGQGTPPARVPPGQGTPLWPGYPPGQGTPPTRVPPQPGPPPARVPPRQGTPPARVPPLAGPGRVPPPGCPMAFWEMLQSIMGYGYPSPPKCGQTENITFPILRMRAVTMLLRTNVAEFSIILLQIST